MQSIARDIDGLKTTVSTHAETFDSYLANANRSMNIFVGTIVALAVAGIGAVIAVPVRILS